MQEGIDARMKGKKALDAKDDLERTANTMYEILLSTDRILTESVTFGNLSKDKLRDRSLKTILEHNMEQAQHQPSIYHQSLVNDNGEFPSANQLQKALEIMKAYTKGCNSKESQVIKLAQNSTITDKYVYSTDTWKNPRTPVDFNNQTKKGVQEVHVEEQPDQRHKASQVRETVLCRPSHPDRGVFGGTPEAS